MWLSFLFRGAGVACAHELLSGGGSIPADWEVGGSTDTNPLMNFDYGSSPVLIVLRDPGEVVESLVKNFDVSRDAVIKGVDVLASALDSYLIQDGMNEMQIRFKDLSDNEALKEACNFILPGRVSFEWIEYMQHVHIQTTNRDLSLSWASEFMEELCA